MENEMLQAVWPEWKIVKRINRGSYGVVYEAVRTDHSVESRAAIKVISIPGDEYELDSLRSAGLTEEASRTYLQEVVEDFVNEIRIMETFKGSQNIVSVEDYKVVEKKDKIGWDIYIRMELLTPFNEYISDKTLTEKEVIKLGCDICSALERCAMKNVIHRDVKPDNIFINAFGDFKLGDFGIARKLENVTGGLSQKGTYNYMAPEVEKGNHYDATVDIYSLGVVLYWLMNKKRLPFVNTEKQLLSPHDLTSANRRRLDGEALPAPCDASPEMAKVILKACDPDPARRFSSAKEMKEALKKVEYGRIRAEETAAASPEETMRTRHGAPEKDPGATVNVRRPPAGGAYAVEEIRSFGEEKKRPGWIPILLSVILALLIGGTAFAIIKNRGEDNTEETETTEETAEETTVTEDTESASETAAESPETDEAELQSEEQPSFAFPQGTLEYGGHHYYIYEDVDDSWDDAMNNCLERGGYLAVINSEEENETLFQYMLDSGFDCAYFGLTDRDREGAWRYTAGDDASFTDWGTNIYGVEEPNNADGGESYAMLDAYMVGGHWNDAQFGRQVYTPDGSSYEHRAAYICEWDD